MKGIKLHLNPFLLLAWLTSFLLLQSSSEAKGYTALKIPFQLHAQSGSIDVMVSTNENPSRWGYGILSTDKKPLDSVKGFPVCLAKVTYKGEGYQSSMGWIQFVTFKKKGDSAPTVLLDRPPQLENSEIPFLSFGPTPTLFDAPSMLDNNYSRKHDVNWRADAILVASPDGVMTRTVIPIGSFSWGYKTGNDGQVSLLAPESTHLENWRRFAEILRKKFPDWTFKEH